VKIPEPPAVVGALPVKVWPSTVTVELPLALLVVTVPIALAATPPIGTFQSFFKGRFELFNEFVTAVPGSTSGPSALGTSALTTPAAGMPIPGSAFAPALLLSCCRVKRGSFTILSHCSYLPLSTACCSVPGLEKTR
jgi:hypothetical protein